MRMVTPALLTFGVVKFKYNDAFGCMHNHELLCQCKVSSGAAFTDVNKLRSTCNIPKTPNLVLGPLRWQEKVRVLVFKWRAKTTNVFYWPTIERSKREECRFEYVVVLNRALKMWHLGSQGEEKEHSHKERQQVKHRGGDREMIKELALYFLRSPVLGQAICTWGII